MTKTEAASIIATDVRVFARTYGIEINKDLVEARISECRCSLVCDGSVKQAAAQVANWRTVLRLARKD